MQLSKPRTPRRRRGACGRGRWPRWWPRPCLRAWWSRAWWSRAWWSRAWWLRAWWSAGLVPGGLVGAGLVPGALVFSALVFSALVHAGLAVLPPVMRAGMPLLAVVGGEEGRRGAPHRCGAPGPGGQGRRRARHHLGADCPRGGRRLPAGRRPLDSGRPLDSRPPQAVEDGQHPARVPGVGPGDREARSRERGMHLLILGIAGHRRADLRQGPDRRADVHRPARCGSRTRRPRTRRLDADRRGTADQVRRTLLVGSRAAQVHRVPVVADAPAGVAVQPVDRPARRDPDRVPGVTHDPERRTAGLRREPHRGPEAGHRLGRGKYPESCVRKRHDQRKGDYPTHLHPPECDSTRNRRGTTSGLAPSRSLRLQLACASPVGAETIRE